MAAPAAAGSLLFLGGNGVSRPPSQKEGASDPPQFRPRADGACSWSRGLLPRSHWGRGSDPRPWPSMQPWQRPSSLRPKEGRKSLWPSTAAAEYAREEEVRDLPSSGTTL
ncbi:uncharacterized protein LOC120110363 isoform X2 [Phoenix dactylifera]|uniref:Uncharacterized protein LOC120110363 isoform X2 n=1 Tax=Phoenix dactylifera TaxID=42345 RepID=A0A8B9A609_PHODC|nr:uncharacterized protein LOC120110363 isoform X2 [Phoenix dactylifera]